MIAAITPAVRHSGPKTRSNTAGPRTMTASAIGAPMRASTNAVRRKSGSAAAGRELARSEMWARSVSETLIPMMLIGSPSTRCTSAK